MTDDAEARVLVGQVVKPHGIRGEVVVRPLSDVPGRFDPGVILDVDDTPREVLAARPHQGRFLLLLEGIRDRNEAEGLRGAEVYGPVIDLEESEVYYAHELVGLEVLDEDGSLVGIVRDVIELPAAAGYDLLEIERPDRSVVLLPAVDELMIIDETDGSDVLRLVDPPEGLFDLSPPSKPPPEGGGERS